MFIIVTTRAGRSPSEFDGRVRRDCPFRRRQARRRVQFRDTLLRPLCPRPGTNSSVPPSLGAVAFCGPQNIHFVRRATQWFSQQAVYLLLYETLARLCIPWPTGCTFRDSQNADPEDERLPFTPKRTCLRAVADIYAQERAFRTRFRPETHVFACSGQQRHASAYVSRAPAATSPPPCTVVGQTGPYRVQSPPPCTVVGRNAPYRAHLLAITVHGGEASVPESYTVPAAQRRARPWRSSPGCGRMRGTLTQKRPSLLGRGSLLFVKHVASKHLRNARSHRIKARITLLLECGRWTCLSGRR